MWQFLFLLGTYGPLVGAFWVQRPRLLVLARPCQASLAMPCQPGHAMPARPCQASLAMPGQPGHAGPACMAVPGQPAWPCRASPACRAWPGYAGRRPAMPGHARPARPCPAMPSHARPCGGVARKSWPPWKRGVAVTKPEPGYLAQPHVSTTTCFMSHYLLAHESRVSLC